MSEKEAQQYDGLVVQEKKPEVKRPNLYKVILLNDDYTPMEFVVEVLQRFFYKRQEEAIKIMLEVHHKGSGVCGVYTYEIAETKVRRVLAAAGEQRHPLQCTMEPA